KLRRENSLNPSTAVTLNLALMGEVGAIGGRPVRVPCQRASFARDSGNFLFGQRRGDPANHGVGFLQYFAIPETQDPKAGLLQEASTFFVVPALRRLVMMLAIDLDYELCLDAAEISKIGTDWMLAPEPEAQLTVAQPSP